MVTVLLVDDERATRTALKNHIPWADLGISVTATAANGLEALEAMRTTAADLVLCDVRMPKMDGVALATALRQGWPECTIVFLSGYSDKEYLKTAIRVHAAAYIDKPLNIPELTAQMRTLAGDIRSRRADQSTLEPARRRRAVEELFSAHPDALPRAQAGWPWLKGPLRVGVVASGETAGVLDWLNSGEGLCAEVLAGLSPGGRAVLVAGRPLADSVRACEDLAEALRTTQGGPVSAFSSRVEAEGDLAPALRQAEAALTQAFYRPDAPCFFHRPGLERRFDLGTDLAPRLAQALQAGDLPVAEGLVRQAGERAAQREDPDTAGLRQAFSRTLGPLARLVPGWTAVEAVPEQVRLERELEGCPSLAALVDQACAWLARLFRPTDQGDQGARRIEKALTFIRNGLADPDLSVAQVAGHLALSEAYLCTFFRKATGRTVKEAVTEARIERARELLVARDDKLQAIALEVGFRDTNYFCTVFKRETGVTPGDFRERGRR